MLLPTYALIFRKRNYQLNTLLTSHKYTSVSKTKCCGLQACTGSLFPPMLFSLNKIPASFYQKDYIFIPNNWPIFVRL